MPFNENLSIRSKIRAIEAAMPTDMEDEAEQLGDLAERAYELDESNLVQRIRPILREIRRRAGGKGENVPDFPLAGDARKAIYDLETTFIGAGYP
ncbi:hypothetical protein [Brevibacterium aurantiacum]|uniref:hypothetical protein n=1 Tax=Brevibacterium aurantiacum TaxID=273384 RepID=UPI0018665547|nr:hypothetical protein [Brevibacterium aurantiacum]